MTFNINDFKVKNGEKTTHIRFTGGRFHIPIKHREKLYKYTEENPTETIIERTYGKFILFFDIDDLPSKYKIDDIISEINTIINDTLIVNDKQLKPIIMHNNKNKKSFHVFYNKIIVNRTIVSKLYKKINNKLKNVVDGKVYRTGLRLFNTFKYKDDKVQKGTFYVFKENKYNKRSLKWKINNVSIHVDDDAKLTSLKEK